MKKLLTILLLIVLVGESSGYFHAKTHEMSFIEEADEKSEKSTDEKKEKEYVSHTSFCKAELSKQRLLSFYSCKPAISPVLDNLTPPPDMRS